MLVEAALAYRHRANTPSATLTARQAEPPASVVVIVTKAQLRLCPRYRRLAERGKPALSASTVIPRELLDFIWAIGHAVEPAPTSVTTPT